jgi:hypothetical protein
VRVLSASEKRFGSENKFYCRLRDSQFELKYLNTLNAEHSSECFFHLFQCFLIMIRTFPFRKRIGLVSPPHAFHPSLICHRLACFVLAFLFSPKVGEVLTKQPVKGSKSICVTLGNTKYLKHKILFSTTYEICFSLHYLSSFHFFCLSSSTLLLSEEAFRA